MQVNIPNFLTLHAGATFAPLAFFAAGLLLLNCSAAGAAPSAAEAEASRSAFARAYRVLQHPRCLNCHPAQDRPLVGDLSQPHPMQVRRGPEGMGANGLWCSTCHQDQNLPQAHQPPGAPGWQLPTSDLPMVFQGRSAQQLCEQMKDPARNGQRTVEQVVDHVREAPLVGWGWQPGAGRTPVPVPREQFVKDMAEWAELGAFCPGREGL
jgi:hypothetical protein